MIWALNVWVFFLAEWYRIFHIHEQGFQKSFACELVDLFTFSVIELCNCTLSMVQISGWCFTWPEICYWKISMLKHGTIWKSIPSSEQCLTTWQTCSNARMILNVSVSGENSDGFGGHFCKKSFYQRLQCSTLFREWWRSLWYNINTLWDFPCNHCVDLKKKREHIIPLEFIQITLPILSPELLRTAC